MSFAPLQRSNHFPYKSSESTFYAQSFQNSFRFTSVQQSTITQTSQIVRTWQILFLHSYNLLVTYSVETQWTLKTSPCTPPRKKNIFIGLYVNPFMCHAARISLSNTIKILRDILTVKIPRNCYEYEHNI